MNNELFANLPVNRGASIDAIDFLLHNFLLHVCARHQYQSDDLYLREKHANVKHMNKHGEIAPHLIFNIEINSEMPISITTTYCLPGVRADSIVVKQIEYLYLVLHYMRPLQPVVRSVIDELNFKKDVYF